MEYPAEIGAAMWYYSELEYYYYSLECYNEHSIINSNPPNHYHYESKFILDSFIFRVSPARFLRWFAAIVDFSTWSRVCSCDLFGINQVRFLKWLDSIVDFFTQSHDGYGALKIMLGDVIRMIFLPSTPSHIQIFEI